MRRLFLMVKWITNVYNNKTSIFLYPLFCQPPLYHSLLYNRVYPEQAFTFLTLFATTLRRATTKYSLHFDNHPNSIGLKNILFQ